MPARNIVKTYLEDSYYHIYNRGVEKRDIFLDEQDCQVFLHYVKLYLSPKEKLIEINLPGYKTNRFLENNLSEEVDLLAFSLMPNHIHLLIKQKTKDGIVKFVRRLVTAYVMYFNKKYNRVGGLFQNSYKAALIESEPYLLHLSRYIHLNPRKLSNGYQINFQSFSSYPDYIEERMTSWLKPGEILQYFRSSKGKNKVLKDYLSYKSFVEDYFQEPTEILGDLILEDEDN